MAPPPLDPPMVRESILDDRPKSDVFLVDEIRGFPSLNPHEIHGFH